MGQYAFLARLRRSGVSRLPLEAMHTTSRRWFRFSLRTALIVLTLACLVAAWVGHRLNWIRQRQEARATLVINAEFATTAPGLLWLFGEKGEEIIFWDTQKLSESEADRIRKLFPESECLSFTSAAWGVDDWMNFSNPKQHE